MVTEGRIRPSYIAAPLPGGSLRLVPPHRGANSPLLHCGVWRRRSCPLAQAHRGANSPLLHCGSVSVVAVSTTGTHRGANSPLLHCGVCGGAGSASDHHHRGANSPLLHCGSSLRLLAWHLLHPPRGEFAPPTLRPGLPSQQRRGRGNTEGRIRPSYIAACSFRNRQLFHRFHRGANSPLLHCG